MVRLQIVERHGASLYRTLIDAMRSGELRTLAVSKRGRKITHANPNYPGWINLRHVDGLILCDVLSPYKTGGEWRLLSAFIGRLADKYAGLIQSIAVQFPDAAPPERPKRRRARRR